MDEALLLAVNGARVGWLDPVMGFLSRWGIYAFPLVMLGACLRGDRWMAARSVRDGWLTWYLATTLTEVILKPIFARPRPTAPAALLEQLDVLGRIPSPGSLACPSGTATAAFAGACWIGLRWGWWRGGAALALATLVSTSRLYAGVHWPSDLLMGGLVGAASAFGLERVSRRLDERRPDRSSRS